MASIKFNLDKPSSDLTYVLLKFTFKGQRLIYSTGVKISPSEWNEKKQRLKEGQKYPINTDYNIFFNQLEREVFSFYRSYLDNEKTPSLKELREHLNQYRGKTKKLTEDSFFPWIKRFKEDRRSSPKFKPSTIKDYNITEKHLLGYCEKKRIRNFDWENIDLDFFNSFIKYLYNDLKFSKNYVFKIIKTLKTYINNAKIKGIKVNDQYKAFSIKRTESQNIYLALDELSRIYQLDLSERQGLERVRDLFLIGSFTGLRYSDFSSLKKENFKIIDNVEVLTIKTQKTGEVVVIPLHPIVKAILAKYDNKPPKAISNQKTNAALKKIAEQAKLDEDIIITKNKAGQDYIVNLKQWQLVTTHTARRSFATNAFKAGISSISIMKITGHKSESSFLKYIKISKEENAVLMAQNPFFKMSPLKKAN